MAVPTDELRRRLVNESWHTLELQPGLTTPGWWDLRPAAERVPWPRSLSGLRCLDVGTMDGFWAFEMEGRGASEVMAIDLADPSRQDSARGRPAGAGARRGPTFALAAQALGSRAPSGL